MTAYRFEDCELDSDRYELRRDGRPVRLERRAIDLLIHLVRNRGRVVSKEEILAQVWKGVVVDRHSVEQAVYSARRALGDDSRHPRVIETVRGRGLRFVAEVVERRRGRATRAPGTPWPPFVGRTDVLAHLEERLHEARAGNGRLVLLSGEPGIGKTRVTEEFVVRVRKLGGRAHVGRSPEDEGAPAFWPWVQLLRAEAAHAPPDRIRELFRDAPHLAAIAPGLAPSEGLRERLGEIDPGPARFALFDALTRFWCASAREEPRVLVLEDLHRADEGSWILLGYLAREIAEERVLLLGTFREAEMHRDPMRREALARMQRDAGAEVLPLGGLDDAEVRELLDRACDAELAEPVVLTLRDRSGGNPFFLARLLELVEEGGPSDVRDLASSLPRTLREAIARQLDGLPSGCRHLLTRAAVIGREFRVDVLTALLDDPSSVEGDLAAAVEGGLVAEMPGEPGAMAFGHALVRDALYDDLTPAARARLHARVVGELERGAVGARADHPERLSELAHHCLRAVATLGPEPAIESGLRAGRAAAASLAFEEAVEHFGRALAAGDAHGISDTRRCDLLLGLGEAQTRSGRRDAARETFTRAAGLAKRLGAADRLARVALAVAPGFFSIEVGVTDPFTVSLLEDALTLVPPSDPTLRARLLARLAMALYWSDETDRIEGLLREAEELAAAAEGQETRLQVEAARLVATWGPDNFEERRTLAEHILREPRVPPEDELLLMGRVFRFTVLMEAAEVAKAREEAVRLRRLVDSQSRSHPSWYSLLQEAMLALAGGDLEAAKERARGFLARGERFGDVNVVHSFAVISALIAIEEGRARDLIPVAGEMWNSYPTVPSWRIARALLCSEAGETEEANRELDALLGDGSLTDLRRDIFWVVNLSVLGDLACNLRRRDAAGELVPLLLPYGQRLAIAGYGSLCWGAVGRVLGRLMALRREWRLAWSWLVSAERMESRGQLRLWLTHTYVEQARMLVNRGRSADAPAARRAARRALQLADQNGLRRLGTVAGRLEQEAEMLSVSEPNR